MATHSIVGIIHNQAVICALIAWFLAQALKIPLYYAIEKRWDYKRFFGSGGMPSSHSAMVVSLAVMVGSLEGFDTPAFAITLVMACIVMYDAAGVRRETGTQATVINEIIKDMLLNGRKISDEELKELVGHTPLEVLCGAILGALTSFVYLLLM